MSTKTLLTYEEFIGLPKPEAGYYELDEGEIILVSPPKPRHRFICDRLIRLLSDFVEKAGLGKVVSNVGFRLSVNVVRAPDVAFLSAEQLKNIDPDEYMEGAPALAIEVVSPADSFEDVNKKVEQYLSAGAYSVWVIVPKLRNTEIYRLDESRVVLGEGNLITYPLLPGFTLPVSELFA
jgi:Uma2 family endonuclease